MVTLAKLILLDLANYKHSTSSFNKIIIYRILALVQIQIKILQAILKALILQVILFQNNKIANLITLLKLCVYMNI